MIDLHIHTSFSSDGMYRPETILKKSENIGLKVISFTDHNEILANFIGTKKSCFYDINYITGIEITSLFENKEIHILGYFINHKSESIIALVNKIKDNKMKQAKLICQSFKKLGFKIEFSDVISFSKGKTPTGVSFLKALLKHRENLKDERLLSYLKGEKARSPYMHFYYDWLKPGKPAYVPTEEISYKEAISTILESCGLPVIAHPTNLNEKEILKLKKAGLCGIEVFTPYHNAKLRDYYYKIALKYKLIVTAGSDFHGERIKKDVKLGNTGIYNCRIFEKMLNFYKEFYGKQPNCL
jgi:predicted metal-dependent phosphoesterase TrpH